MVDEHLRELADRLAGPARLKSELLTEARHGLLDAVEAYRDSGVPPTEAQRRAVVEFGSAAQLLPPGRPSWRWAPCAGSPADAACRRSGSGRRRPDLARGELERRAAPPAGYQLLSTSVDWIWMSTLLLSVAGLLVVAASARSARPGLALAQRAVGAGLTGLLALAMLTGAALFTWSFNLWDAALHWPR
ncbi:permease prefix domain 1-containing protein [Micromonospora sp. M12]